MSKVSIAIAFLSAIVVSGVTGWGLGEMSMEKELNQKLDMANMHAFELEDRISELESHPSPQQDQLDTLIEERDRLRQQLNEVGRGSWIERIGELEFLKSAMKTDREMWKNMDTGEKMVFILGERFHFLDKMEKAGYHFGDSQSSFSDGIRYTDEHIDDLPLMSAQYYILKSAWPSEIPSPDRFNEIKRSTGD